MELTLVIIAVIVCLFNCVSALDLGIGIKSMARLTDISPTQSGSMPHVSIIVPACNEADNIEQAMCTLLAQEYENYEIIAINDRSTDRTADILDRMAEKEKRLKVVHIHELPEGWLGKNHAMHRGASLAQGEYLLFTDADIMMEKTVIARAVQRMVSAKLSHFTLLFKNSSPGWLLNSLILDSGSALCQILRPWRAKVKDSGAFVGVGAFNMVSREIYDEISGHEKLKMHPVDDLMLGKLIKENGGRQECLLGYDMVTVPWYSSVADMVEGLMKNVLAVINYRLWLVPGCVFILVCINVLPFWGMLLFDGIAQLLFGVSVVVKTAAFYRGTKLLGISPWCALGTLLSPYLIIYIIVKAAWRNGRDRGIFWRGTFYSLTELRKNRPLFDFMILRL